MSDHQPTANESIVVTPADQRPEPRSAAGRRLFTDNYPMDMLESDGVTWADILAIERERTPLDVKWLARAIEQHRTGKWSDPAYRADFEEANGIADAYAALWEPSAEAHKPGDHHRYRIECEVCGQRGTIRLSIDPGLAGPAPEPDPKT